jgi:site-specific recombinase XerD
MEKPETMLECQRILSLPFKKKLTKSVDYLTPGALRGLLAQPDAKTWRGRRDLVLIITMYDTAARVQELIDLTVRDIRLESPAIITLTGKGNKRRCVPVLSKTKLLLEDYMTANKLNMNGKQDHPLFFNSRNHKFTRPGIAYLLGKYFSRAKENDPNVIYPERLTPHMLRHTKAMHLLEAGVNLIYIRDFLGHVNVTTTEIYAKANSEAKRKALEAAYLETTENVPIWREDTELLRWLQNLCK